LPSLAIGIGAFCAGELIFKDNRKEAPTENKSFNEVLLDAKNKNEQIKKIWPQIEDQELVGYIKEIHSTVEKIITTVEKKPSKYKKMNNFFSYYLPVTVSILKRYDEIENQKLTTEESKEFMLSAKGMMKKINEAFKKQLSNLYQSDMIDTDAEMKVFETMLEADGFGQDSDFNTK
jgi:5-bromo-4-chloroindolyl phosphate hydrolysis protein